MVINLLLLPCVIIGKHCARRLYFSKHGLEMGRAT